ncbi:hypothetical protein AVEN_220365-1 [Araneus ventricosus]|uniref:Uncharacterized protein n=1 Tax=Araneus ventricosus TaxID=182803 RepID=A0A4Y2JIZ0_ARAVE|nr:hypothetical protein AVEN_220365-1 [Araneus ventricosus]
MWLARRRLPTPALNDSTSETVIEFTVLPSLAARWHCSIMLLYTRHARRSVSQPDLNPCDFFLWGHLKDTVYRKNPTTIADLVHPVYDECERIKDFEECRR